MIESTSITKLRAILRGLFSDSPPERESAAASVTDWPQYLGTFEGSVLGAALESAYQLETHEEIQEEILNALSDLASYELLPEDLLRRACGFQAPSSATIDEIHQLLEESLTLMRDAWAHAQIHRNETEMNVERGGEWITLDFERVTGFSQGIAFESKATRILGGRGISIVVGDTPLHTAPSALQLRMFVQSACRALGLFVHWDWCA